MAMVRRLAVMLGVGILGCAQPAPAQADPGAGYLGQVRLPHAATFAGTVIGGLSAISYDPGRGCYYLISDDRSATGPARFYTAELALSRNGIDGVTITATHPLLDVNGAPFPPFPAAGGNLPSPPAVPPDPEGIAFDAGRQRLYWSSEGERLLDTPVGPVLADPWIRIAGLDGSYLGSFTLPANLAMSAQRTGPRRNLSLEGLTLAPGGALLFAGMEGPRYDDGDPPDRDHGALVRITAFDLDSGGDSPLPTAQYAYPLEPAAAGAETNGLSDLVALSDTEFLVVERAFGVPSSTIRVFHAETAVATDVLAVPSLADTPVTPMRKTLVADLSAVSPLDNVEGITLGPVLPDGRQSVVLVSDDNFSERQLTQFLLLAR